MTSATGSPTYRTRPRARPGCGGANIGEPSGRFRFNVITVVPSPSAAISSPVKMPRTPGTASAAAMSIDRMRACACGERNTYACAWPGRFTSLTKRPWPRTRRGSSKRGTAWPMPNSPAIGASAAGDRVGEADLLLRRLHALRRRVADPPVIDPSGRPLPVFGATDPIARVDPVDLRRVLDHEVLRADEVREYVIARPGAADAPFDPEPGIAQTPSAAHDRFEVRQFEGDVVQGCHVGARERDVVVMVVAGDEVHHSRLVGQAKAENVDEERRRARDIGRVQHDVRELVRASPRWSRVLTPRVARDRAEDAALAVLEREAIAAAGLGDRCGRLDRTCIGARHRCMERIDILPAARAESDAEQLRVRPPVERDHVVRRASAAEVDGVAVRGRRSEAPDLGVEAGARWNVRDADLDAA